MDPNFVRTHFYIINPYLRKGMNDAGFQELVKGMIASGDSVKRIEEAKRVYSASGFKGLAKLGLARPNWVSYEGSSVNKALDYVAMGEKDSALKYLELAYEERVNVMVTLKVDPFWDGLRTEPRFTALLKKIGFEK